MHADRLNEIFIYILQMHLKLLNPLLFFDDRFIHKTNLKLCHLKLFMDSNFLFDFKSY